MAGVGQLSSRTIRVSARFWEADQDGQHCGQQGICRSVASRERCHRGHHQQGKRSLRTYHERPGGAEHCVSHGRKEQYVQSGDRGEPGQFGVGMAEGMASAATMMPTTASRLWFRLG